MHDILYNKPSVAKKVYYRVVDQFYEEIIQVQKHLKQENCSERALNSIWLSLHERHQQIISKSVQFLTKARNYSFLHETIRWKFLQMNVDL